MQSNCIFVHIVRLEAVFCDVGISRLLSDKIERLRGKFPVMVITGPRQSGKTTLIRDHFSDYPYFNLEDLDTREYANEDPRGFLRQLGDHAVLDEVQRTPKLFSYIQGYVDQGDKELILSGSQNFLLLESITQSLAGRSAILTLWPFSMEEISVTASYEEQIIKGFYPRLYDKQIDPSDYYPNYIATYLERNIKSIKSIDNFSTFTNFLELTAGRVGQVLNMSSLASAVGVSPNTIKSWLSVLHASHVIHFIRPYHKNYNKRISKSPKLYFTDVGLASSLLGLRQANELHTYYNRGALFENLIINELLKHQHNRGIDPKFYYWREKNGNELDLIIHRPSKPKVLEIKSAKTKNQYFYKGIKYWEKITNQYADASVIYGDNRSYITDKSAFVSWKHIIDEIAAKL